MNISQHTVTGPTPAELDFDPIGCDEPLSLAFRSLVYARGDTVNLRYKVQSAAVSKPPYRKSFRTEDSDRLALSAFHAGAHTKVSVLRLFITH